MLNYISKNSISKLKDKEKQNFNLVFEYKIYTKNGITYKKASINESSMPSIKTELKDKNKKDIYLYDILKSDDLIVDSWNTTRKENYFICIFDNKKCKIDFLYFDKSLDDFLWIDDYSGDLFYIVGNGLEILNKKDKKINLKKNKILSIINHTNDYFKEND